MSGRGRPVWKEGTLGTYSLKSVISSISRSSLLSNENPPLFSDPPSTPTCTISEATLSLLSACVLSKSLMGRVAFKVGLSGKVSSAFSCATTPLLYLSSLFSSPDSSISFASASEADSVISLFTMLSYFYSMAIF